jgi:uncharacterized membrane protein YidH (DUF202 family)
MKIFNKTLAFLVPIVTVATYIFIPVRLNAANFLCDVFPFLDSIEAFGIASSICGTPGTSDLTAAGQLIRFALSLVFVAIIAISIYVIIRAALKYIRSEGDPGKVEEAQKAIKNVFIGIGALFVGIIGIVIILAFFQAGNALNTSDDLPGQNSGLENFLEGLRGGSGPDGVDE